jgi:iron complex outermembrane receptor protein
VRLTAAYENGKLQPSASWTRNLTAGEFIVNYSLSAFHIDRDNSSTTTTLDRRLDDGTVTLEQIDDGRLLVSGGGVHATARIQWRPEGGADSVTLTPILFANRFHSRRDGTLTQAIGPCRRPTTPPRRPARTGTSLARLNSEWTHRFGPEARVEWRAGVGQALAPVEQLSHRVHQRRRVAHARGNEPLARHDDHRERQVRRAGLRGAQPHLRARARIESPRRHADEPAERAAILTDFSDNIGASTMRLAGYAQDEWSLSEHWGAHAGLRWEGIRTRGSVEEGQPEATNQSSVWTPLLHAVWKPDPKGTRPGAHELTRSYRSPRLSNLISRPSATRAIRCPGRTRRRRPIAPATRTSSPSSPPASTSPSSATSRAAAC